LLNRFIPRNIGSPGGVAALVILCILFGSTPALLAQRTTKSDRKVLVTVKPEYSELLKHAQIGGLVRLKVTVSSEGKVTNVDVAGGNPILAESAAAAVTKWKFVPAATQTIEEISISFSPH
jgi:TonB family protein